MNKSLRYFLSFLSHRPYAFEIPVCRFSFYQPVKTIMRRCFKKTMH